MSRSKPPTNPWPEDDTTPSVLSVNQAAGPSCHLQQFAVANGGEELVKGQELAAWELQICLAQIMLLLSPFGEEPGSTLKTMSFRHF
ncbi:hypothetical protein V6N11_066132 [Hibiscus sabdariffa]|uniref:Uncharacterized protein n=1 Tax=Hibiscus sabdariffa TaxID=183260 RepID=A0ABR2NUR5_9ROSI